MVTPGLCSVFILVCYCNGCLYGGFNEWKDVIEVNMDDASDGERSV